MELAAESEASPLWTTSEFPSRPHPAPTASSPAIVRFSTRGLHEPDRIALWEQHNARALVGLQARTLNGNPLEATELNLQLSELQFAHVVANAHIVERDSREVARTPGEAVALYFTLWGESFFYHRDGVHLQRPGGLLVCDVNEPFMRGFAQGLQEFALTVPRAVFERITGGTVPRAPITMDFARIPGANTQAAALARLIKTTLSEPCPEGQLAAESSALDLLQAIFCADTSRNSAGYRLSALSYIDVHLRDPRLSVSSIAHSIGISERHLSRIFSDSGSGISRTILERRLTLARRILSQAGAPPVGEVAGQCGFSSHAHFTRVFRERFEETPAQTRARSTASRTSV
ncbi:helix-turn-helix domain-containing protein [Naasia lichenicola]|uniref:Helix-turn-helix domain-containing protein n=1 Tax=Naasia lichenicola TaxID=2565933 RepID=A0A4S4FPR1_9MICO|nr:helix-turn-helix domain-containing protein [Naasia lichenicola]THG31565.1 helix-turn-helix domain-containing protein [Naasia lichenicola]